MYDATVIERNIAKYEASASHKLIRNEPVRSREIAQHIDSKAKKAADANAKPSWSKEELLFIRNERVMATLDFRYWSRYALMQKDGGGACHFDSPWESQLILLARIAKLERELVDAALRGEPVDGILIALHKARQLGATAVCRMLNVHRCTTQRYRRAMAASVDDDKIQELYDRDKLIIDNLPSFLRPGLAYDEKRGHIYFDKLDSRVIYQVSSQKSGLGVGRQFDLSHLTELSTWNYPRMIELDFFPTIPQSLFTLAILESTAYMIGDWWNDFTERVRRGQSRRWKYVFIPWYAEASKYRAQPPTDWQPSEIALLHAQKVHDTSAEFMGRTIMLPRENLFWWETTRAEYKSAGSLNLFLVNYCATPEESFQHATKAAFDSELIESLRLRTRPGSAYEVLHI